MTEIPYYSSWWSSWIERKLNGDGSMAETVEYVCPNCGLNKEIDEVVPHWVTFTGRFGKYGEHEMTVAEPYIGDSIDSLDFRYECFSCGHVFTEPITLQEFNAKPKEELEDNNGRN